MSITDISYLELWRPFCLAEWNHLCNFGRGYHEEQFCKTILNLDHWLRMRCHIKDYLSRALECATERNHLCNFGRGHYWEHSCDIILNLDKWFRRCRVKKEFKDGRCITHAGRRPITIAHLQPLAQVR